MSLHLATLTFLSATGRWARRAGCLGWMAGMALALPAQADESVEGLQLGAHTYSVSGLPEDGHEDAGLGFVVTASSVVVIDAADSPAQAVLLLDAIRQLTPRPVSHLLLTRRPGSAEALAAWKAAGAATVARRPAQPIIAADGAPAFRADLWIDDSTDLLVGGVQIQAIAPAGSPGIVYLLPEDGVLFVGDLAEPGRIPDLAGREAPGSIPVLDELLRLRARVVVPARGPAALESPAGLQFARDYLAFLNDTMAAAVRAGEAFEVAYQRADWSRFVALPGFAAFNRTNAEAAYRRFAASPLKPAG